ncbi:unnamed protein product, partial [Symbiodinium necroappetens]
DGLTGSAWGDWANYTDSPLRAFEEELGVQAPVGFWDPVGYTRDGSVETFKRRRETEIKHGRVAMYAASALVASTLPAARSFSMSEPLETLWTAGSDKDHIRPAETAKADGRIRCHWDGDPATYPDFMRRVRLSFERTPRKKRHLLGPEVVASLSGRAWIITQDLDHRLLVRRHHYRQLQVALGRVRKDQEKKEDTPTNSPATSRPARSSPPSTSSPRRASRETQEEPQGEDDADEGETVGPPEDDREELLADGDRENASPSWRRPRRKGRDTESDSDDSTRALADMALWERYDETLPDVLPSELLGWLLLRRAGISHQASLAVQSAASGSLRLDDIEKALRAMEDEILQQELRPRGGLGASGKGHGRHRTYWVEEGGEWSMWLGENNDLDELFDGGEIHYVGKKLPPQVHPEPYVAPDYTEEWNYYGSGWEFHPEDWSGWDYDSTSWWYDELSAEQQQELEEAYAAVDQKARSFVEARQAVKARNLSRGFYPFAPSSKGGAFKGKKGKGKGKPKGKGYGAASSSSAPPVLAVSGSSGLNDDGSGFLGAAVGDPAYTGCFICGSKAHDFRHCPKRQNKGGGKGSVHFASEVGTIFFNEDLQSSTTSPLPWPSSPIYAIQEDGAEGEIFSQDPSEDLSGYAVLDSGATETVASLPALEALMKVRQGSGGTVSSDGFQVLDQPPKKFKFGNGEFAVSSSFLLLPQQIGEHHVDLGVYTLDVVGVPVLIGIKTMMRLHAVVDFAHCRAVFAAVDAGLVVPLRPSFGRKDRPTWTASRHDLTRLGSETAVGSQDACVCQPDPPVEDPPCELGSSAFMAKSSAAGKSKTSKKAADPLDEERTEGPDLRDPRVKGGPCFGNHKVAKAYKGSVSGSNQYASWTGCEVCKIRLTYTPRMGCHGIHRKSAPLAKDVTSVLQDLPPETEAYPSNKEISLTAAENSALARLEHLRRLRKDGSIKNAGPHATLVEPANTEDQAKTKDQSSKNTGDHAKTRDQSSKNTGDHVNLPVDQQSTASSPMSPGTIVVDPEELPRHPGRKDQGDERANFVSLLNTSEVEAFADYLTAQKAFDYQSMEELLGMMKPRTFTPGRAASIQGRKAGFSMVFGLYAHGSYYGTTRASRMYPSTCRYFNSCLRNIQSETVTQWTSVSVLVNMKGSMHLDAHNDSSSYNLAVGLGPYQGGELWVELRDGDPSKPDLSLSWRELPGGRRAPGQVHPTRWCPTTFSPKRYHKTLPWTGTRFSVIAYTARSWPEAQKDSEVLHLLRQLQFPLPRPTRSCGRGEDLVNYEDEVNGDEDFEDILEEEPLTLEDRSDILATYQEFEGALMDIFLEYPNEKTTKVVNLCTPWLDPLAMDQVLQEKDWNYQGLSHHEGCDLSTHSGYQAAREQISHLQPEWLWCHIPRGPLQLFATEQGWDDPRRAVKAKRYLKTLRHALLLSRDHVMKGGKLAWLIPADSLAPSVREQRFWSCYGRGSSLHVNSKSQVLSNVVEVADLRPGDSPSKFWTSMTTISDVVTAWLLDSTEDTVFPVDTSCLNTLTSSELERLMQHVRQLHRRFGHPSNRLLVKNLLHRNADEKVVAAASQLECDECLESQIKMPSPAVNLDKCEKLWSCLQVDGFHLRCGATIYHFLLMVDEASGFAVVREMFSHPEEDHQNMSGPDVVQVLQEAWFQYFGYPDTVKLDLEGALRSRALHEACVDKGIDLVPAPAEYHEMIADVEREIGYVRQHLERFLRGGAFERPGQAALAAVTAHNSLARVHGFSPLQWALGRDMSLGHRASEAQGDQISATRTTNFNNQGNLRLEAEQAFLKHRADQLASRAKNAKVRVQVRYFPGDMVFYRRHKTPADLPANSWVDRPRLRGARWYGPARVLACETKTEEGYRKPSQYVWAICSGRLKKFHATQLRHASPSERLTHEALRDITMPWTMTSLTRLLDKGSYDDETRTRAARNVMLGRKKRGLRRVPGGASPPVRLPDDPPALPPEEHSIPPGSDEEMIPDDEMRKAPRLREPETAASSSPPEVDVDRLLHDPQYMPSSRSSGFQEQRRLHEQEDRPWHVQHGHLLYSDEEVGSGIYAVTLDTPANDKEWRKVLKDPRKFLAKSVQKGVEVSWNRLNDAQRVAMSEAKKAEVDSWLANRVVKAALPHITMEQSLRMRWIYTFKAAEPGK